MALVPPNLEKDIKKALARSKNGKNAAQSEAILAKGLAIAIDKYVRAGTVNTTVVTAGTAVAQAGTGIGSIS